MKKKFKIQLNNLQIKTKIGCTKEERKKYLDIKCNITIILANVPRLVDDTLSNDYTCYAELSELIYDHCINKEFRLLENITNDLYKIVRAKLEKEDKLIIRVIKPYPKMKYIADSSSCEISDE